MTKVRFLIKNNNSEGNRDIVVFLKENITTLNTRGVIIDFRFIEEKEIPQLVLKGIDKLPAAFVDDILFMDSINIKDKLSSYLSDAKGSKKGAKKAERLLIDPDEMMDEFKRQEMNKDAADADTEEEDNKNNFMLDYQKELRRREVEAGKEALLNKKTGNVSKTGAPKNIARLNNVSISGTDIPKSDTKDKDDDMLTSMFEETL